MNTEVPGVLMVFLPEKSDTVSKVNLYLRSSYEN
jgi:hypothetical protein